MNNGPTEEYLTELARQPWPWKLPCGWKHELTKKQFEQKIEQLKAYGRTVSTSPYVETMAEASDIPSHRLREGVVRVFHLTLGPKNLHCVAHVQVGRRKKQDMFYFCYHHDGHCPHSFPMKLIRKHV